MPFWLLLVVLIVVFFGLCWLAIRSAKRWQAPPPSSGETKDAEATLWSKMGFGKR